MSLTIDRGECDGCLEAVHEEALREQFILHMAEVHPSIRVTEEIPDMVEEMVSFSGDC